MKEKTKIALTMGYPLGVGPEIAVLAVAKLAEKYDITIFGDKATLARAADLKKIGSTLNIKHVSSNSFHILDTATKEVMDGLFDCLVTCPINKNEWHKSGVPFIGHTEFLAERTKTRNYAMMMAGPKLRVTIATIHVGLRDVYKELTEEKIITATRLTHNALERSFGIKAPRLGISGLNPHCSDKGIFRDEEEEVIKPAITKLKKMGIIATGPISGDYVFIRALKGDFDAVVSMYHDQGLAPVKTYDFEHTVNITLGIPIIRTSVDHGTGEDIAWKGVASDTNLIAAIEMAAMMARNKK